MEIRRALEEESADNVEEDVEDMTEQTPAVESHPDTEREIDKIGYMRPITNHTLKPITSIWDIAHLAGFGGRDGEGFDALEGIDKMVTGEVDAMSETRFESWTEGSPLQIGPSEDFRRAIVPEYDLTYDDPGDWMEYL